MSIYDTTLLAAATLSPTLYPFAVIAAIGTGILFVLSVSAYRQRRSTPYLLVTCSIGALVLRSIVGIGTIAGFVPMYVHHLVEHTFDFLIAVTLLAAVYLIGRPARKREDARL
ncbi:MAG: DUF7471 family protein [Halobacteriota archaeon]